jgi:outer membrane lipoprotein-sorting protein
MKLKLAVIHSLLVVAGMSLLPCLNAVQADNAPTPQDGRAIAVKAKNYAGGFADFTSNMKMILRDKDGRESVRSMRFKVLETRSDGDKSLVTFDLPKDIAGTSLLTFTKRVGSDDQWLFLPALKRVKRIAAENKSGPFMGSEFAYEDIASQEVEKYQHTFVREESLDGQPCYVLDQRPADSKSGYNRRRVWLDKEAFRTLKVEFYNRRDEHEKTLTSSNYKKYLDHQWRPLTSLMVNHLTGKSTTLEFSDFKFKAGLSESDFDSARMQDDF